MQQRQPDFAILEVGLGGRLDAVNIIDADLVHLTPIGLDHQAFLGNDRESIGFEKAGVLRRGVKVVLNDADPPQSVLGEIDRLACNVSAIGRDYHLEQREEASFCGAARIVRFARQRFDGEHQAHNLAGVVAGLVYAAALDDYSAEQLRAGFHGTRIAGRLQQLQSRLACRLLVDVGHNQDAARVLAAAWTDEAGRGPGSGFTGYAGGQAAGPVCRSVEAGRRCLVGNDTGFGARP